MQMGETKRQSPAWNIVASVHKLIFPSVSFVYPLFIYLFWFQMPKSVKRSYLAASYNHGHNILRLSDMIFFFFFRYFIFSQMIFSS